LGAPEVSYRLWPRHFGSYRQVARHSPAGRVAYWRTPVWSSRLPFWVPHA